MLNDHVLFLDILQLSSRGWTKSLIRDFLKQPDRFTSVSHWKNFTGKAQYSLEKVLFIESSRDFCEKFQKSILRRKLSDRDCAKFLECRNYQNQQYKTWLANLKPEDVKLMMLAGEVSKILTEAISRGYRTPHK